MDVRYAVRSRGIWSVVTQGGLLSRRDTYGHDAQSSLEASTPMSLVDRVVISTIGVLSGITCIVVFADRFGTQYGLLIHGVIGSFCLAIALAPFLKGRSARFVGSLVAMGVICLAGISLALVVNDVWSRHGDGKIHEVKRDEVFGPILLVLLIYGGIRYVITERFGFALNPALKSDGTTDATQRSTALVVPKDTRQ